MVIFTLNYDNIKKDRKCLSVTKLLATLVTNGMYVIPSRFISQMHISDLDMLLARAESTEAELLAELLLIAEMLAVSEGLDPCADSENTEEMMKRMHILIGFLATERISRDGLVEIYYENMSFGPEFLNKTLCRRVE